MALLLYRLIVCSAIAVLWCGVYNTYKNIERTKGAKIFLVVYSLVCALVICAAIFLVG